MEREAAARTEPNVMRSEHHWISPEGELSAIARWILERACIGYGATAVLIKVAQTWPQMSGWCVALFVLLFGMLAIIHVRAWREGNGWAILSGLLIASSAILSRFQQ